MEEARKRKIPHLSDEAHVDLTERSRDVLAQERNERPKRITHGRLKGKGLLKALVAQKKEERAL